MGSCRKTQEKTIPDGIKSLAPVAKTPWGKDIYADNPFITASCFSVTTSTKSEVVAQDLTITDKKAAEIAAGAIIRKRTVDTEQFVKFYSKNIGFFFDLSATAQRTVIAVILAVQDQSKNKAEIFLSYKRAVNYYESINYDKIPTKHVFSRGINQLIESKFIANHWLGAGWYWTNPNILFNGDRIAFIDLYVEQRKIEKNKSEQDNNVIQNIFIEKK